MASLCAVKSQTGTASTTVKLAVDAEWLFITNKSGANLTFTVTNDSGSEVIKNFVLLSGDTYDCRINQFRNVDIVASGFFQVICSKYVQEGGVN